MALGALKGIGKGLGKGLKNIQNLGAGNKVVFDIDDENFKNSKFKK